MSSGVEKVGFGKRQALAKAARIAAKGGEESGKYVGLPCKGCAEKHSNTTAHHPVVKPPAAASHESVAHSD